MKEEYKQVMTELKQLAETKYQEPDGGTMVCELCGQQLPLDQIAEHQEKHRKLFEANKEKKQAELEALKDDILQKAQKIKEYASGLKSDIEKIEAELSEIDNEISIIKQAIAEQEQAIKRQCDNRSDRLV